MKLLLGTRLYVDFPTVDGIIYPRSVIETALLNEQSKIRAGKLFGGIFDKPRLTPKDGIITHIVRDIKIYNDEIAVEIETLEGDDVKALLDSIEHKSAAVIIKVPTGQGGPGTTVRSINSIEYVHIREDRYAQLNRSDSED